MTQVFERNNDIEAAELNDEAILFNPDSAEFYMLNATSAFLWEQLASPSTAEMLGDALLESFSGGDPDEVRHDVDATLNEFTEKKLVLVKESGG